MGSAAAALLRRWRREEKAPFSGWGFEHIAKRSRDEGPGWSFPHFLAERARAAESALDLGTGGGEQLRTLGSCLPRRTIATEAHAPNRRTAAEALAGVGVPLVAAHPSRLPFASRSFGLVSSRHTGYHPEEIARVLRPGGTFLTQQIGSGALDDLAAHFGAPPVARLRIDQHVERLERSGLRVERAEEGSGQRVFDDVAAVVYMLRNIPWLVEDFGVERHAAALRVLQQRIELDGSLRFAMRWCLLVAARPEREETTNPGTRPRAPLRR